MRRVSKSRESPSFETVSGVLYKRNFDRSGENLLLVLPRGLRKEALIAAHSKADGGHLGVTKTYGKIMQKFYRPRTFADTDRFVKSCRECQQRETDSQKLGSLQPIETPSKIFHTVGVDLLSFNATDSGNKVIATAVCHLFRFLIQGGERGLIYIPWRRAFLLWLTPGAPTHDCYHTKVLLRFSPP